MQTFDGQAPSAAHDRCLSSTGRDTVTIQGDYYVFVAVGLCFNAQGSGSAVDLGIQGSSASRQVWRRRRFSSRGTV